jgi:hypothetical protein
MLIKVTESHIKNGIKEDCNGCAIALALSEAGFIGIAVSDSDNIVCSGEVYRVCGMLDCNDFDSWIDQFDMGVTVNPFEFEIELKYENEDPTPYNRPVE